MKSSHSDTSILFEQEFTNKVGNLLDTLWDKLKSDTQRHLFINLLQMTTYASADNIQEEYLKHPRLPLQRVGGFIYDPYLVHFRYISGRLHDDPSSDYLEKQGLPENIPLFQEQTKIYLIKWLKQPRFSAFIEDSESTGVVSDPSPKKRTGSLEHVVMRRSSIFKKTEGYPKDRVGTLPRVGGI